MTQNDLRLATHKLLSSIEALLDLERKDQRDSELNIVPFDLHWSQLRIDHNFHIRNQVQVKEWRNKIQLEYLLMSKDIFHCQAYDEMNP